jgi:hypothetical protein
MATLLRKLSFSSKLSQRSVVIKRNSDGEYGFTLAGGLEENRLPCVKMLPNVVPLFL